MSTATLPSVFALAANERRAAFSPKPAVETLTAQQNDEETLAALRSELKIVKRRIATRKYRANSINSQKEAARIAISRAISSGALVALACENCGAATTEAHHDDYNKPLEVRWLCKKCHASHHQAQKPHCGNGHPWIAENIYVSPGGNRQYCLTCKRIRDERRGGNQREVKRLTSRISQLERLISGCADYFKSKSDAAAMKMLQSIEEVL
jgi:ribosomal protein S27AE